MKTTATASAVERYWREAQRAVEGMLVQITKLGDILLRAADELTHSGYVELQNRLLEIFTQADLDAAIAVANGTLDRKLFPSGSKASKVLSLKRIDQDRLLSGEKFEVYADDGTAEMKPWSKMTATERDRLLGPKGGYLHSLSEQRKPGIKARRVSVVYDSAHLRADLLQLEASGARGEISIPALRASLAGDDLRALIDILSTEPEPEDDDI